MKKYVNDCEGWLRSVGFLPADQRNQIIDALRGRKVGRHIRVKRTESQVEICLRGEPPLILTSKEQKKYLIHCLKDIYSIMFFSEEETLEDGFRRNMENPNA